MNARTWMILLLTGLWFWACQYWYTCSIKEVGYGCKREVVAPVKKKVEKSRAPLMFSWEDAKPITNNKFAKLHDDVLEGRTKDNILTITGPYLKHEENTSTFKNMGIARANMIKELFIDDLSEDRIRIKGHRLTEKKGMRSNLWEGATFVWNDASPAKVEKPSKEGSVVELDDKALIYFPYNSVDKVEDERIDKYLTELTKRVKKSKEKVILTGHTDSQGAASGNEKLGLRRAKMIRDILIKKGVKKKRIKTRSEGEKSPVAPNNTELGRHQNRRVVVNIIK